MYEHKNCVCFRVWRRWWWRRWAMKIDDHTKLLKGSFAHTPKNNILQNMYEHKNLCLFFVVRWCQQSQRQQWWRIFSGLVCLISKKLLINIFFPWYPLIGTLFWALYDGISIVRWYISRTAGSKLNLYSNPSEIWLEDILFDLKGWID